MPDAGGVDRRTALRIGIAGGLLVTPAAALLGCAGRADPFTLGVASGEPTPEGVVLWTRLATDPLADDGLGGMGARVTDVEWELAEDASFRRVVRRGVERTGPELGHSVHVEVAGLAPGREYSYRFRADGTLSPAGRTRTAPAAGTMAPLTMCFTSCAQYEHGFFTAYARLAQDEPELVLHLGDYLYEHSASDFVGPEGNVRAHIGPEIETLADYRRRHAQYKTDPDLQAAHAVAPWLVVWDDHEVDNNWAGELPENPQPGFAARRAAAMRAYWENMPLRAAQRPDGTGMPLFRRVGWGAMATFHMLDTRQYRTDQPCSDERASDCPERLDPARTLLGAAQERWLADGFRSSQARWDVLGQQVFFAQLDITSGQGTTFNTDAWDGAPASRDRVVDAWTAAATRNPVVLTGDVHAHWAADVRSRFGDPASPVVGTELVTSSISTGGDGSAAGWASAPGLIAENPHLRFHSDRRGYVRTRFTATELTAEFRALPAVRQPGAAVATAARFVVEDRRPGVQEM